MRKMLFEVEGINQKTLKPIRFKVPAKISLKGLESLSKNVAATRVGPVDKDVLYNQTGRMTFGSESDELSPEQARMAIVILLHMGFQRSAEVWERTQHLFSKPAL